MVILFMVIGGYFLLFLVILNYIMIIGDYSIISYW
jgi:hypothetical protein